MDCLKDAFGKICENAKKPGKWYVCLIETQEVYGGPEEGGWYQTVADLIAYQEFVSEEQAEKAQAEVWKLAKELETESLATHGQHLLDSMDWLDERGLEPEFLREPDGPTRYAVVVGNEIPNYDEMRRNRLYYH